MCCIMYSEYNGLNCDGCDFGLGTCERQNCRRAVGGRRGAVGELVG